MIEVSGVLNSEPLSSVIPSSNPLVGVITPEPAAAVLGLVALVGVGRSRRR